MRHALPILALVLLAAVVWLRQPREPATAAPPRPIVKVQPVPSAPNEVPAIPATPPEKVTEPAGPFVAAAPEGMTGPRADRVGPRESNYRIAFRYLDLSAEAMEQLLGAEAQFAELAGKTVRDPAKSAADIAAQRTAIAQEFLAALGEVLTPQQIADYLSTVQYGESLRAQRLAQNAADPARAEAERVLRVDLYLSGYMPNQLYERWIAAQTEDTKAGLATVFMAGLADYRLLIIQQHLGMTGANPDGTTSIYEIPLRQDPEHMRGPTSQAHGAIITSLAYGPGSFAGSADTPAMLESPLGPMLQQRLTRGNPSP